MTTMSTTTDDRLSAIRATTPQPWRQSPAETRPPARQSPPRPPELQSTRVFASNTAVALETAEPVRRREGSRTQSGTTPDSPRLRPPGWQSPQLQQCQLAGSTPAWPARSPRLQRARSFRCDSYCQCPTLSLEP